MAEWPSRIHILNFLFERPAMEFKRWNRLALFATLALMLSALSARASTISITGSTSFGADVDWTIDFSGPSLGLSISTCDAADPLGWTTPMTFTALSGCATGSASYRSYTWTTNYTGFAPDEIIASITGVTEKCGSMMLNPDGLWSDTCSASFSGNFDAYPALGPGPTLLGTITGSGTVNFTGSTGSGFSYVHGFNANFSGTADVTSPVPEPGSLPLVLTGVVLLLALALRRLPEIRS
jgi:hypothetical protein